MLRPWRVSLLLALMLLAGVARAEPVPVAIGQGSVSLTGPWRFQLGDDPRWAQPGFDDSSWETVDLTPPPGAHDDDVGLPGYVPGWDSHGHAGYTGYAWYRLRIAAHLPTNQALALAGPFAVDSAYQLYVDGKLLGGVGDFSGKTPTAGSDHRPTLFALPADAAAGGAMTLAIRVWAGPWDAGAGGIHIAPQLGESGAVTAQYRLSWLTLFEGYVVDAVEGVLFLLLALVALGLKPFERAYGWFALGLLLLGVHRGNQAVLFWGQFETIHHFEFFIMVLTVPLCLGVWLMAWRSWFRLEQARWLPGAIGVLVLVQMLAQFLSRSWFHGMFPPAFGLVLHYALNGARLISLALFLLIFWQGVRKGGRQAWFAAATMLVLGMALFAQELSSVGAPGIWFPYGIGVSRTEYAYAAFDILLTALFYRQLLPYARIDRTIHEEIST